MDRLLTTVEMKAIKDKIELGALISILREQDSKTLKVVGKWLSIRWAQYEENAITGIYRTTFKMSNKQWESLKRGEMPEELERETDECHR